MDQLIKLLKNNARITNSELAVLLDKTEEQVAADIAKLEADGVIKGYSAIVDESAYDANSVFALIELKVTPQSQSGFDEIANQIASYEQVESVRLMSGAYDIIVAVNGANIRDISQFVSQRLATIDAVQSTATHFVLKVYKDNGIMISSDDKDERGLISP
ncbi:Lrp/AsnC family transcriptional regulator [Ruminococcus sp. AM43-6]|jgi:DNA-binding Lrp family transcriptional regulator|uniref:Lrp/AsnC family transcriptional regulator n=1 Tax=Ruminococcus sp. AM43-6 TaxID=2293216 RepID=UPI000E479502|nr:Lrp/AsnC family transcriptional regulator [Ruminococcus sp. AM43-6]RGH38093.1 Lrp/AsnC family transcriptional regulator [Ruminococcus sp. AM43-6]UYJ31799.1 MAG: Lrp/AsnC family transcriptional regulator [Oscillospiraceae bacterium]